MVMLIREKLATPWHWERRCPVWAQACGLPACCGTVRRSSSSLRTNLKQAGYTNYAAPGYDYSTVDSPCGAGSENPEA